MIAGAPLAMGTRPNRSGTRARKIWVVIFILVGLAYYNVKYRLPRQEGARQVAEEKWRQVSPILLRKGNIEDVIDRIGDPDNVQTNVPGMLGKSGTCYWWGSHSVFVSQYDEAIGTCYWAPKP